VVRLGADIEDGRSLAEAMDRLGRAFPPLVRNLVRVGQETGNLDAVLSRLADYYELQRGLVRQLISRLVVPGLQYFAAVGVVTLATWIGANLARGANPFGVNASATWILAVGWGLPPALFLAYRLFSIFAGGRLFHEIAIRIPGLGGLLRSFALGRFAWCMSLCSESGVSVFDGVGLSLSATGNEAFAGRAGRVRADLRGGCPLHEALRHRGLFPVEFIEIVNVAEESGTLSQAMERVSKQHFAEAERRARTLASAAGWVVWLAIAGFIIAMIFRVAVTLVDNINRAVQGAF
jgi:type II secretory pathway component PulF